MYSNGHFIALLLLLFIIITSTTFLIAINIKPNKQAVDTIVSHYVLDPSIK